MADSASKDVWDYVGSLSRVTDGPPPYLVLVGSVIGVANGPQYRLRPLGQSVWAGWQVGMREVLLVQLKAHSPERTWSVLGVGKAGVKSAAGEPIAAGHQWEGGSWISPEEFSLLYGDMAWWGTGRIGVLRWPCLSCPFFWIRTKLVMDVNGVPYDEWPEPACILSPTLSCPHASVSQPWKVSRQVLWCWYWPCITKVIYGPSKYRYGGGEFTGPVRRVPVLYYDTLKGICVKVAVGARIICDESLYLDTNLSPAVTMSECHWGKPLIDAPVFHESVLVADAVKSGPPSDVSSSMIPYVTNVVCRRMMTPFAAMVARSTMGQFEFRSKSTR